MAPIMAAILAFAMTRYFDMVTAAPTQTLEDVNMPALGYRDSIPKSSCTIDEHDGVTSYAIHIVEPDTGERLAGCDIAKKALIDAGVAADKWTCNGSGIDFTFDDRQKNGISVNRALQATYPDQASDAKCPTGWETVKTTHTAAPEKQKRSDRGSPSPEPKIYGTHCVTSYEPPRQIHPPPGSGQAYNMPDSISYSILFLANSGHEPSRCDEAKSTLERDLDLKEFQCYIILSGHTFVHFFDTQKRDSSVVERALEDVWDHHVFFDCPRISDADIEMLQQTNNVLADAWRSSPQTKAGGAGPQAPAGSSAVSTPPNVIDKKPTGNGQS